MIIEVGCPTVVLENSVIKLKYTISVLIITSYICRVSILVSVLPVLSKCSPLRQLLILDISALQSNQTCSISDKMLIKKFSKLLETILGAYSITASPGNCTAKLYEQSIQDNKVYSSRDSFAMNEIIGFYLDLATNYHLLLATSWKLRKKSLFCKK